MSQSDSSDELDDSDKDPDFFPEKSKQNQRISVFDAGASVSTTIDSDSSDGVLEQADLEEGPQDKKKVGRKRSRNPKEWKRNVAKKLHAEGKSYMGLHKKDKVLKNERSTGPDCKCKFQCFSKFTDLAKLEILSIFNNISNKEKQDLYLGGQVHINPVVRKRPKSGGGRSRSCSCSYVIKLGPIEVKVCKKAFCSLQGVSRKRVERIVSKVQENVPAPQDMRGKHLNRPNRIPEDIVHQLDSFIQSFPKRTSHYSRTKNEDKYYLSPELNMSKMHKLYIEKYEPEVFRAMQNDEQIISPRVTYHYFCHHFVTKYNYSFGKPRSDTCQTCDRLKNLIDAEKNEEVKKNLLTEKELHEKKATFFYTDLKEKMNEAKNSNEIEVLVFDYQQNMPLPHVTSGDVFFKRQLWEYNFCIYAGSTGKSYFFMYDETMAKKGQNDVVSMLDYFIKHFVPETIKTLYIFSDNCSSQNKNQTLVHYLYIVAHSKIFSSIIHRYPEPGHSFLPCDRSFGLIEKEKRKRERIILPEQWVALVKNTSKNFIIIPVSQNMFLNFSDYFKGQFKKNVINQRKVKFAVSAYRKIEYTGISIRCSILASAMFYEEFVLQKPGVNLTFPNPDQLLYSGPLPIKKAKYLQVQELAKKYVSPDCMWFYDNLRSDENDEDALSNSD